MIQNNEGYSIILGIMVIVALVVASTALMTTLSREPLPGIQGEQGPMGINGTDGRVGATGPQGPQGATGAQGPIGEKGPPENNTAPTTNITLGGRYTELSNISYQYDFNISVQTHDSDNDTVQTTIYYRKNTADTWTCSNISFIADTTVPSTISYLLTAPSNQKLYYAVQAWDGRDFTMRYAEYMIPYP